MRIAPSGVENIAELRAVYTEAFQEAWADDTLPVLMGLRLNQN
ncbi:hypothetical protein ACQP2X_03150 [Actinoplanes sp. CA-131856]